MAITADMVKKLREQTGAGMMDCKKALTETNGDFEKAITLLREKGIAVAAKRESRAASEGLIGSYISDDAKVGALLEFNCETTFVAKTDEFVALAKKLAALVAKERIACLNCLLEAPYPDNPTNTVRETISEVMGKIGEKMAVARFVFVALDDAIGTIGNYVHMGDQIGVLVEIRTETEAAASGEAVQSLAKDIAMHVAWTNPDYMRRDDISEEELAKEREIHRQWAIKEGKPEKVIDRIVDGRMNDFFSKVCLLEQAFIKDDDLKIQDLVANAAKAVGERVSIAKFVRYRVGETTGDAE
ncbi:MAG: elongation factor Ts [Armatimonadetes bacterium]|nr:elongation factor Ts [Armatimonadota bacterium]